MKDGENRISLIKDVEITNGKAYTIYSALNNKTEKCGGFESLCGFESDADKMIGHKEVASKLKRNNPKIISIHYHNHRLVLAILSFFKENATFLMKKII